jgi:hypothetical protein
VNARHAPATNGPAEVVQPVSSVPPEFAYSFKALFDHGDAGPVKLAEMNCINDVSSIDTIVNVLILVTVMFDSVHGTAEDT